MKRSHGSCSARVWKLLLLRCRIIYLCIGVGISVLPSLGQEGGIIGPPKEITPLPDGSEHLETISDAPLRSIADRPGLGDGDIRVGTLRGIDSAGLGILGPATGGFARDLWQGSERLAVEMLLAKLPVATTSPTMNNLARRLLLTAGPLPKSVTRGSSILGLRLERLYAAGRIADLDELITRASTLADMETVAPYQAKIYLLSRNYVNACELASRSIEARNDLFWLQLRTFCFVMADQNAAADLTADLLRERNIGNPSFFAMITRMTTGADIEIPSSGRLDVLSLAMHAELGLSPSKEMQESATPVILVAIAMDDRFDVLLRLKSAEKAVQFGAMSVERLAELYDQVEFTAEEIANALTLIEDLPPAQARALVYRMLKTRTVPSAFAEALDIASALAIRNESFFTAMQLYWPIVRGLIPSAPYADVATDIGRMALFNRNPRGAYNWFDMARQTRHSGDGEMRDFRILLAVGAPSDQIFWQSPEPLGWLNAVSHESKDFERLVYNIQILDELGYPVSQDIRLRMLEAPFQRATVRTSPVILTRLKRATTSNRLGETVLLSLIALGQDGPQAASLTDLLEVYSALYEVGLSAEARQVVLEAVLATQLKH